MTSAATNALSKQKTLQSLHCPLAKSLYRIKPTYLPPHLIPNSTSHKHCLAFPPPETSTALQPELCCLLYSVLVLTQSGGPLIRQVWTTSCNKAEPEAVKSRGSTNGPNPKHCGTLFLSPHCCVWVLEPVGESTAQVVPVHFNCVQTLGSYLAVMFNTPPSKLGNDFPLSQSSFRNSFPLENKLQNTLFLCLFADCSSPLAILSKVATKLGVS